MNFWIIFVVFVLSPIRFVNCDDGEYRLPSNYHIQHYDIQLSLDQSVFSGSSLEFTGTVKIDFQLLKPSTADRSIQLHASFTNFTNISLYGYSSPFGELVKDYTLDTNTSILTINTTRYLSVDQNYTLEIKYIGELETLGMHGFYRSSYIDPNNKTRYLVATQFEPVHARKAFPCFDEPQYKATYTFSITYPQGYTAFFNTPQIGKPEKLGKEYELARFDTTPNMSTYLVAFSVSDFSCNKTEVAASELVYRVCSREETVADRELASEYGPILLEALGKLTGIDFNQHDIGKMDTMAIPDFSAGAMENYGLVNYRETALLWSKAESSNRNKQSIITTIAHEFSHMWFGDLVTINWWNNIFLNEGFAAYFEYFTIAEIDKLNVKEKWEIAKQFVVETQQGAFLADSSSTSAAITSEALTPTQISDKFSTISYSKGASVIRMLENVIEKINFLKGIQNYLKKFAHENTKPSDLWTSIETVTSIKTYLPDNVSLAETMDNWINKPGYPIVQVSVNGNGVNLTQKRFLYEGKDDTKWYVPISYTVSSNISKFQTVTPEKWLTPYNDLTLEDVLNGNEWIVFNNQESAYYRVNYDSFLWEKIRTALFKNHSDIDVLNRAQIVDDLFNLAKAGELQYSEAFAVIKYLEKETEYYPWYSAINGFQSLTKIFAGDSKITDALKTLQLDLIKTVLTSVPFKNSNDQDQIYTFKKVLILQQACNLGEESCLATATELFNDFKNDTSVDKNLKLLVYCNGLRYSTDIKNDWTFMWNKFQATSLGTEQVTILSTLGCTKDKTYLEKYLQESIKSTSGIRVQDLSTVWKSVVNSNTEGVDVAIDFFIKNHKIILEYYPGATSFISTIASALTSEAQVTKLKTFINDDDTEDSIKTVGESAIATANANLKWVSARTKEFKVYFGISGASPTSIRSILLFVVATVLILN